MEEMLKTWKQPVAGSMDTRPVFSPDLVRPIENALMKAKAAMMPQAQLPGRPRPAIPPYRNTPTPPGMRSAGGTPNNLIPQPHAYPPGTQPPNGQMQYPTQPQVSTSFFLSSNCPLICKLGISPTFNSPACQLYNRAFPAPAARGIWVARDFGSSTAGWSKRRNVEQ